MFQKPIVITNLSSLKRLKQKVEKLNISDYILNSRPNSRFVPVYITNINFDIALTNFPLGSDVVLPNFVKNSNSIITFISDPKTGKKYNDNLCFF